MDCVWSNDSSFMIVESINCGAPNIFLIKKFDDLKNIDVKKIGLNIALVPANMSRLSFGPCKKNCFWSLQNFLFFKIVPDPIFVMICIRDTWWLDPFCSFWSLQNILFFKQVPAKNFVSENSPWRDYFKKQKILQGPKTNFFFYKDQNLNETYLQGPLPYFSQENKTLLDSNSM